MRRYTVDFYPLRFVFILHTLIGMALLMHAHPAIARVNEQIDQAATELAEAARKAGKKSLAVMDFTDLQDAPSELGRYLADELTVALVLKGQGLTVFDRTNLQQIIAEHRLSYEGLVDGKDVLKLGQFTAVTALAVGKIVTQKDEYKISIRLLATDTSAVIGAVRFDIPRTSELRTMEIPGKRLEASKPSDSKGNNVIPFAEKDGFDKNKRIRIRIVKLDRDIQGDLVLDIIHESLQAPTSVSVFKPRTYLIDNAGVQYKPIKTRNIPAAAEMDLYKNDIQTKRFPQGVGIRYSIIFPELPQGQTLTLALTYLEEGGHSKQETHITIPGVSW